MDAFRQDFRYALRSLVRRPGFTLAVVATLALGLGANTAVFSVINTALLRGLPFERQDRLVWLWEKNPASGRPRNPVSHATFTAFRDQTALLEDVGASRDQPFNITGGGEPETLIGYRFSANFLRVLGARPLLGRGFLPDEDRPGNDRVAILSHRLWQRRFAGDPAVVGRPITLNGDSYTVVGVMPPEFQHPPFVQIWVPLALPADIVSRPDLRVLRLVARLRDGVTREQAQTALAGVSERLARGLPESHQGWGAVVEPIEARYTGDLRLPLLALAGAVAFVLLIACANVAHLLLARAAGRERELAVRAALGASRGRVARQLLTESLVLALAGGGAGLLLARWGVDALLGLFPTSIGNIGIPPRMDEIRTDGTVLLFALGVSLATGVLAGLAPARSASRSDLTLTLKDAGRGSGRTAGGRLRSVLVVAEVALALVLSVGALLMVRSFLRLQSGDLGFDPDRVLTARIVLPDYRYREPAAQSAFVDRLMSEIQALPGVESAGVTTFLPLSSWDGVRPVEIDGMAPTRPADQPQARFRSVSPDYFRALRMRLVGGRAFTDHDRTGAAPVAIVNQTLARSYYGSDALGRRLRIQLRVLEPAPPAPEWREIVGVVADVRHDGLANDANPTVYLPYAQEPMFLLGLAIRTTTPPETLAEPLKAVVRKLDPDQPVLGVYAHQRLVADHAGLRRVSTTLLAAFAGLALVLSAVGIYGIMAYSVTQRTHEIGVRMALGAEARHVLRMVVGRGAALAGIGVALGLVASLFLTRALSSLLFGVSATDPASLATVALLLMSVALLASWLPARRALGVDPIDSLRYQ